jgi:hypothetical protein
VARQAAIVISIGLALGLGGSFALTRLLKSARRSDRHRPVHVFGGLARIGGVGVSGSDASGDCSRSNKSPFGTNEL